MHLRYAILALLTDGEAHDYQLLKRFNRRLGPFWHPNIGQVYQLLHELEQRGFVARRDEALRCRRFMPLGRKRIVAPPRAAGGWPPLSWGPPYRRRSRQTASQRTGW